MNYSKVYNLVDDVLQTREGINNPKQTKDYDVFVREVTGLLCGIAYQNDLTDYAVQEFLSRVKNNRIQPISDCGGMHNVSDLLDSDLTSTAMYNYSEFALMNYKPGKTQVGPGEFFFCFYDELSEFGIDNQNGYDIVLDGHRTELKKLGTNFTDPDLFDHYEESPKVDRLMVVKPVSDATVPVVRSKYSCITLHKTPWRDVYEHRGKNGSLCLVE